MGRRAKRKPQGNPARIARERTIRRNASVPQWQRDEIEANLDHLQAAGVIEWQEIDAEAGTLDIKTLCDPDTARVRLAAYEARLRRGEAA